MNEQFQDQNVFYLSTLSTAFLPTSTLATMTKILPTETFIPRPPDFPERDPPPGSPEASARNNASLMAQLVIAGSMGIFCFLSFCYLRRRFPYIYSPRLQMKKHAPEKLPDSFFGWVGALIRIPEDYVLEKVGLDSVVFLQFFKMGIKTFATLSFLGLAVILPINVVSGGLSNPCVRRNQTSPCVPIGNLPDDDEPIEDEPLSFMKILTYSSTLPNRSSFLIAYFVFTYVFSFVVMWFMFVNYRDYVRSRRRYLLRRATTLPARTIMVSGIPSHLRNDRALAEYFEDLGVGRVESTHVVRQIRSLRALVQLRAVWLKKLESTYTRWLGNPCKDLNYDPEKIMSETVTAAAHQEGARGVGIAVSPLHGNEIAADVKGKTSRPTQRLGFLGLFGEKVDKIEHLTHIFNELDEKVHAARKSDDFEFTSVGFVTFESMTSVQIAIQTLVASEPFQNRAEAAPEPRDIYWPNIAIRGRERIVRGFFVNLALVFIVFLWGIPVGAIASLTSTETLNKYLPWLVDLSNKSPIIRAIVQGFLPTLAVTIFLSVLPFILDALSLVQGLNSRSSMEEATLSKYYFFLLFNNLLVFTISSTLVKTLNIISREPVKIIEVLAKTLPNVWPFFVNYVVLQGIGIIPIQLLLIGAVATRFFNYFTVNTPRQHAEARAPLMIQYGWTYPPAALIFVIVLTYSNIQPLILLFGLAYFSIAYLVFKYQVLYVYFHPYESAGRAWPMLFPRIIAGMVIFQLTMTGIFVLKQFYILGACMAPLLVLTGLYHYLIDLAYYKASFFVPLEALRDELAKMDPSEDVVTEQVEKVVKVNTPADGTADHGTGASPDGSPDVGKHGHGLGSSLLHWRKSLKTASALAAVAQNRAKEIRHRILRRRRAFVLDDDDYSAEPEKHTDFRQPPMTLFDGILNTGMKRYSHPALTGVLPQLWLPMKVGDTAKPKSTGAENATPADQPTSAGVHPASPLVHGTTPKPPPIVTALTHTGQEPVTGEGSSTAVPVTVDISNVDAVDDDLTDDEEREADPQGHHRTYYHHPESRQTTLDAISPASSRKQSISSPFLPGKISSPIVGTVPPRATSATNTPGRRRSSLAVPPRNVTGPTSPVIPTVDTPTVTTSATEQPHGVIDTITGMLPGGPGGDPSKPFEERFSEFMGTRGADEAAGKTQKVDIEQPPISPVPGSPLPQAESANPKSPKP